MTRKSAKTGPGRPEKKPHQRAVHVGITVPPDVMKSFESRRKREKLTRSAAVTAALREWLGK